VPIPNPEPGWVWWHAPLVGETDVVIAGAICWYWAHFSRVNSGRVVAVRCLQGSDGEACRWCEATIGRRLCLVVPLLVAGQARLTEWHRPQHAVLRALEESGRVIGRRLRVRRAYAKRNAEILLDPVGMEHVSPEQVLDPSEYVSLLGRAEYERYPPPGSVPCPIPSSKRISPLVVPSDRSDSSAAAAIAARCARMEQEERQQ
jgi:hypothetical protein